jgi:hypothetical protein
VTLALRFTRLSATQHRFDYRREDGTGEVVEMESAGQLWLDLLRYAVESDVGLRGSFYGILDKIGGYEELTVAGGAALGGEIAITERVVGALAEALGDGDLDDEAFVARVADNHDIYDERPPRWFTPAFVLAVRKRMREITAQWDATGVGETMELKFPSPLAGEGVGVADG